MLLRLIQYAMFLFISAADGVKERCGEERGADQRREDKRRVYVWLWSSHKNCPLTTIKQIQARAIRIHLHARTHAHTHTHTHFILFCLLKALKKFPRGSRSTFQFPQNTWGDIEIMNLPNKKSQTGIAVEWWTHSNAYTCAHVHTHTHTQAHAHTLSSRYCRRMMDSPGTAYNSADAFCFHGFFKWIV